MKRTLRLIALAVLCGILTMFLPLYIWHQANFPDQPATLSNLRGEALEKLESTWGLQELFPPRFLYVALTISFAIAAFTYVLLKRRF